MICNALEILGIVKTPTTTRELQLNMTWQSKVASWVLPLVAELAIPDDAGVFSDVEFATLDNSVDAVTSDNQLLDADFPGLIPNYSVAVNITPTTGGLDYAVKALKAVGFYGVVTTVLSYEPKKLNDWTFPLVRKNFGFCAQSRGDVVSYNAPIHYQRQFHIDQAVLALLTNYDDQFNSENVFNSADKFALSKFTCFLYPTVVLRVGFLPIWEVWALKFFQSDNTAV